MNVDLQWLNVNSAAIQAVSTVVLVAVTSWYAFRTHQLTSITNEQLKLVRRAQEPDLKVTFRGALVPMSDGQVLEAYSLSAANTGLRSVTVDVPFIKLPDRRTLVFPNGFLHSDAQFPHRLEPGESCTVLLDIGILRSSLAKAGYSGTVKIRGAFRDKTDIEFFSDEFKL